ncbi:MAG: response regulator transcription factor [Acidimicrobiales bacterium]|nr:response regulator transcription factor [Acidimicrobiales bacterium]
MTANVSVLVVDDEPAFREGLRQALKQEGFIVHLAADGEEALEVWRAYKPDVVLLDVMLPRMSGIDVCRAIRAVDETPVIMVSARNEEIDAVVALEVGADDYVAKPYRVRELVARMRTVLRRASVAAPASEEDTVLEAAGVRLDRERHEVTRDGELVQLPLKEFDLLALLMENQGLVVTRQTLIDRVWGYDYVGDTKTLDVHIKRLRAKIEPDPEHPAVIVTIRGLGYKLAG